MQTLAKGLLLSFIFCSILQTACSDVPSTDIKTSGFYSALEVTANNDGTLNCSATFYVGGPTGTLIELNGGDSVSCNGVQMSKYEDPILHFISYRTKINSNTENLYEILLNRKGEATYSSVAAVPTPIKIIKPISAAKLKKEDDILVKWKSDTQGTSRMIVGLSIMKPNCQGAQSVYISNGTVDSAGQFIIPARDLNDQLACPGSWAASVSLERYRAGTMANGLNGYIVGSQKVEIPITLVD